MIKHEVIKFVKAKQVKQNIKKYNTTLRLSMHIFGNNSQKFSLNLLLNNKHRKLSGQLTPNNCPLDDCPWIIAPGKLPRR